MMQLTLKKLTAQDGREIYDMLQEIPKEECGFQNNAQGKSYAEYQAWLAAQEKSAVQEGLVDGWKVPQTTYWLYADDVPVGVAKLRHFLTDALRDAGGHIGYAIRPTERGKGYGTAICRLALQEAFALGIDSVLITTQSDNEASKAVCRRNGGKEAPERLNHCYFWFTEDGK